MRLISFIHFTKLLAVEGLNLYEPGTIINDSSFTTVYL